MELIWSDTIVAEAQEVRDRVARRLRRAGIPGELLVTGPAGLTGVLTRGDIDLHLRVVSEEFADTVVRLQARYRPASRHAWAPTLAVFEVPAARATGLAATPIGSGHDRRFRSSWRRLAADPRLREQYNALKVDHVDSPAYEQLKSDFFDGVAGEAGATPVETALRRKVSS